MPRWRLETAKVRSQMIVLVAGLVCASAVGSTIILDPDQVARKYVQHSWQKKDGLPDNQVQALLQTRDGYLWVGTHRGLARFDGLKFTVFDHLNTPEMPDDNCRSLAEDLEGNLWIATDDGLLRWRTGAFNRLTKKEGLAHQNGVARDRIEMVFADRHGGVWAETVGLDLLRNGTIRNFGLGQGFVSTALNTLHEDSFGVIWTAGGGQLYSFDPRIEKFVLDPRSQGLGELVSIEDDGAGGLWLLGLKRQVNMYYFSSGQLYHLSNGKLDIASEGLPFSPRSAFLKATRNGDLWTASKRGELDCLHRGQFECYTLPSGISRDFVLCLTEDREGDLWFGTEFGGLHCWKPRAICAYGAREGLGDDNTWTVCESRDGSVWVGTENGLSQFKEGRFRNFTQRDGLSGNQLRSVAEDASGALWIGTGSGLSVIHKGMVEKRPFPHKPERDKIRVVYPAKGGALWVGTFDGLYRLVNERWTTFTSAEGLANPDVRVVREDKAGNLWIGTAGGGLQSFRDGKFTSFNTTNGLSSNVVWALHEDADGALWIGTEQGLNRYENGRFTAYSTREGLPADLVNEILEDDFGNLWVSHDHGIYRVRKQELNDVAAGRSKSVRALSYDEFDGLPSIETNGQKSQPAGCKTSDGRLWFSTTKGVAVIDPKLCDLDEAAPQAVVEQVRSDGEIIFDNSAAASAVKERVVSANARPAGTKGVVPPEARRRLPPGSGRVLEFRYTAPIFIGSEKTAFRYRLRGVDDRWIEAGKRREAYFTRLRPGPYDFEVSAASHHGVWAAKGVSFLFYIQPFYYQTWWFYSVCSVAAVGLVAGLVAWRIRELRKLHRLEQQTAIVSERTRIAKDLHDGLGADLTRLALLADLAGGEASAGAGEHLQKLSRSSREAARVLKEMIWIANPANDTVEGLVSRISQTAEDFLGDARIRFRLDLAQQLPQRSMSLEQRRNLLLVAREALNNIVKHSAANEVCIRANGSNHSLQLEIADDGRGFDTTTERSDGLGLASMRRRVESIGGSFALESRPGSGTKILITVKLEQAGNERSGN